jgi:cytochrome c553
VAPEPGIVTVINVYDSKLPWPKDTKITALRIIQLFPKATPNVDAPRIGIADQSLCRGVLGTVPVEADGSAQFYCPPGKTIYFQALDANQLAVQSMRSDTYVQPGQRLTCQGCHDDRNNSSPQPPAGVMALQRAPSPITPDSSGSNPLLFPQLVQPVLDHNCVECHAKERMENPKVPSLSGDLSSKNGWTQSYAALAPLGYWLNGGNGAIRDAVHGGPRSIPGQTGARASKLYQLLQAGHHDLELSREDLHRITLWLDCNSNFFGAYTDTGLQAQGQGIPPMIE